MADSIKGPAAPKATEEQLTYAAILNKGMLLGLIAIIATFFVYASGILPPAIPIEDLSKYWTLSAHEYLKAADLHAGWAWLGMLGKGDFINFAGIALLAGVTVACYISIIPIFLRKKDKVYALFAVLEVAILILAASGVLRGGGH